MRYLTTAAMALVLAASGAAALAQPQGGDQNDDKGQHGHPAGAGGGGQASGQHGSQGAGQHGAAGGQGAAAGVHAPPTVTGGQHLTGGAQGGATRGGPTGGPMGGVHSHVQTGQTGLQSGGQAGGHRTITQATGQPGAQGSHQGLQFHQHALRPNDQGRSYYSRGAFQPHVAVTNRFHVSTWSRPGGWYYRHWAYGMFLPFGWFGPAYYLNWGSYDLPAPPIGCEWVREGPDAVLVDVWTGEILSVYSGVFY